MAATVVLESPILAVLRTAFYMMKTIHLKASVIGLGAVREKLKKNTPFWVIVHIAIGIDASRGVLSEESGGS